MNLFEFEFEFNRFPPVTGLIGPVNRYRRAAVRPVRSDFKTVVGIGIGLAGWPGRQRARGRRWLRASFSCLEHYKRRGSPDGPRGLPLGLRVTKPLSEPTACSRLLLFTTLPCSARNGTRWPAGDSGLSRRYAMGGAAGFDLPCRGPGAGAGLVAAGLPIRGCFQLPTVSNTRMMRGLRSEYL